MRILFVILTIIPITIYYHILIINVSHYKQQINNTKKIQTKKRGLIVSELNI